MEFCPSGLSVAQALQDYLEPDSENSLNILLSVSQILLKNGRFTEDVHHFTLKTDCKRLPRRGWNLTLQSHPMEIDISSEPRVLPATPFFRQDLHLCYASQGLTPQVSRLHLGAVREVNT